MTDKISYRQYLAEDKYFRRVKDQVMEAGLCPMLKERYTAMARQSRIEQRILVCVDDNRSAGHRR